MVTDLQAYLSTFPYGANTKRYKIHVFPDVLRKVSLETYPIPSPSPTRGESRETPNVQT